ncbi:MAG TPA: single-stranded-DNA-specific exonuclease RecJ [Ktedonobacterales bacterium]
MGGARQQPVSTETGADGPMQRRADADPFSPPAALPLRAWELAPELPVAELDAGAPDLTRLQMQLLANRGIAGPMAARAYLAAGWRAAEPPMLGLDRAVERLGVAARTGERVVVFGDYDADGLTSCAIMLLALQAVGARAEPYLPARTDEGRGPSEAAVRALAAQGYTLLVTTDCGTTNVAAVRVANELGMEVVVSDHHAPQGELAPALAVINPHQPGCPSPERNLAGAGVAFRLAEALLAAAAPERAEVLLESLLDLVAIGTVGDVAPLTRENWRLVHAGLRRLNTAPRVGLRALMGRAGLMGRTLTERDISFALAPHLNAAGRMGNPMVALRLLTTDDTAEAERYAGHLRELNEERQRATETLAAQAHEQVAAQARRGDALLVASGADWPLGVIGLVASRLAEEFNRPVAMISLGAEECRGSLRGPVGLHLAEALGQRAALLRHFGGHAQAAGFTVATSDLDALLDHLRAAAQAQQAAATILPPETSALADAFEAETSADAVAPPTPASAAPGHATSAPAPLRIDCRLALDMITYDRYVKLRELAPFGTEYAEPVFVAQRVRIVGARRSGPAGRTLRLDLRDDKSGERRTAMWGRRGELQPVVRALKLVDVAFTLDADPHPGGAPSCIMRVVDVRPAI